MRVRVLVRVQYEAACVGKILTGLNGEPVHNLHKLAAAVAAASSKSFLTFQFDEWVAVIETARSRKREAEVLRAHDIVSWCSRDVDPRGDSAALGCITLFRSS